MAREERTPYDHHDNFDRYDHLWYGSFRYIHSSISDDRLLQSEQLSILDPEDLDLGFDFPNIDLDILDGFDSFSDFDSALDSDLGGDGGGGGGGGDGGGGD